MKITQTAAILVSSFLVTTPMLNSCRIPVLGRYKTISKSEPKNDLLEITTNNLLPPEGNQSPGKTMFEMSDHGQQAYVQAMEKMSGSDAAKLRGNLNKKLLVPAEANDENDLTSIDRHLVFSVQFKNYYSSIPGTLALGDRIEYLKISVKLADSEIVKFSDWDKFKTKFGTYNIATRNTNQTKDFNLNPSIPLFAGGASGSLSVAGFDHKTETSISDTLKLRYVAINGILKDNEFVIEQTGTPQVNLTGNFGLDLTLALKSKQRGSNPAASYSFDDLRNDNGKFNAPADVSVTRSRFNFISISSDLKATLTFSYAVRHIKKDSKGDRTVNEDDDDVVYFIGSGTQEMVVLRAQDAKPEYYHLMLNGAAIQMENTLTKKHEDIQLESEGDAQDFWEWLANTFMALKGKLPGSATSVEIAIGNYTISLPVISDLTAVQIRH